MLGTGLKVVKALPAYSTSYTTCGKHQGLNIHGSWTTRQSALCTLGGVDDDSTIWKERIGTRLQQLRQLEGASLAQVAKKSQDRIAKSRLSNYEQGIRMPGPGEAVILAQVYQVSPAHILCLDDDVPALSSLEADLIRSFRALPENERMDYYKRITALASVYKEPVPDERVNATGYNPASRQKKPARRS